VSAEVHFGDPVRVQKIQTKAVEGMSEFQIVELITQRITSVCNGATAESVLLAVALSVPGEVSQPEGAVTSVELGWREFPLKSKLRDSLPLELHIDVGTEASIGALAEKSFGGAKDLRNFGFLSGVNELSAGLVVNGALLTGRAGSAGRLSRVSVAQSNDGPELENGMTIQSLIGYNAMLTRVQELGFDSIESFYASEDDTKSKKLQSNVVSVLSSLLQNLVVLLGLNRVFLELELANYWSEISGKDIEEFNDLLGFSDSVITRSSLGPDVVQLGLGELGFEMLFKHPHRYFAKAKLLA
jgi:predicted NBD/HSP70 family sugar kinase